MHHEERHGHRTQLGIKGSDHRDGSHIGIEQGHLLDLAGEDLLTATVDHIVGPGVEVEVAVVVEMPEVSRP